MNAQLQKHPLTIEGYLDFEQSSDTKHELHHGEIVAMTGGKIDHNYIAGNTFVKFYNYLMNSPCRVFMADVKLKVGTDFFYPDVMIVCDKDDESDLYKTAPILIVEVLSKSTSKLDKTYKRLKYQTIPSLEYYVLIEQDKAEVIVFTKKESWQPYFYYLGDEITFHLLDLTVSVEELYIHVNNEEVLAYLHEKRQTTG